MKKTLIALIAVLFAASVATAADEDCKKEVKTTEGAVTGLAEAGTCAYKGIPYAAPPVGELRWKPTAPPAKRDKVLEATAFGPECSQIEMAPAYLMIGKKPNRSEDCLQLNVWRPNKPGKYPVMVWIHGGGLTSGSGIDQMYWGDRMVSKKDVVLVTINYRLGVLGFLAHEGLSAEDEHKSSGNYGMLDQVAALKWVHENIAEFGGDAGNVTIFGESAGGWSVCMMMATPMTKGLFQKAILQSGGCDMTRTMEQGFENGKLIASRLGCSGDDALKCMRSKPADKVVDAMHSRSVVAGDVLDLKFWEHVWAPHIDGWFLKEVPIKSLREGNYNHVSFMVGSTRDEARLFAAEKKLTWRGFSMKKVVRALKNSMGGQLYETFTKLYPFSKYKKPMEAFIDAKGDIVLGCKCFDAAEAVSKFDPTWYYRFDFDDNRFPDVVGASHALELGFIFDSIDRSFFKLLYKNSQRETARPLVDATMGYWTNFAITGDPNGGGLMAWPKYDTTARGRMFLDVPQKVGPTDNVEKCEFWRENAPNLK